MHILMCIRVCVYCMWMCNERCISTQVMRCRQIHMYVCGHMHINKRIYACIHEYTRRAAMMQRNVVPNCACERQIYLQITLQIKIHVTGHVNVLLYTYIHIHYRSLLQKSPIHEIYIHTYAYRAQVMRRDVLWGL